MGRLLASLLLHHRWRVRRIRLLLLHDALPCGTALLDGCVAGLCRFHLSDPLERRIQFTLHAKGSCRVIAQHDVVDCLHAIAPRSHDERGGEIVAVLIGCSMVFGIQPMYGVARLLVERMIRMRRVVQPFRGRYRCRLVVEPRAGMAQRIECP